MASRSKEFTVQNSGEKSRPDSVPDSDREPDREDPGTGNPEDKITPGDGGIRDVAPPDAQAARAAPAGAGNDAVAEDEELLEMLEQLSETIDTAHNVLAGQHEVSAGAANLEPPSPSEFLPPPPAPAAKRSGARALLAASAGVIIGLGALAAFWLLWKSPPARDTAKLTKTQDRVSKTVVSRVLLPKAVVPRIDTGPATPPKTVTASNPASTAPPSPAQASLAPPAEPEPPGDEPAAMTEDPAVIPRAPATGTVILEQKNAGPPALAEDEERQLLVRGSTLTGAGDVAGARLAYEYAARRKSVEAMFALAQTFDPEMLAAWSVVGIKPDVSAALEWYGRAEKGGHERAATRKRELEKLTGR